MAGAISGLGTTYNLPNYTGELYQLSPTDTPLLSAIGGLTGGGQVSDTEFEWQMKDLRDAGQNVALEGADAPTSQERVRAKADNILQIHQESFGVSYTKLGAVGRFSGLATGGATNPVKDELQEQIEDGIMQVARDVDYSFINGQYHKPSDNTTKRKTRGLVQAIATNVVNKGATAVTGATLTIATDKVGTTAHGLNNGDRVKITAIATTTGLIEGGCYFVVNKATNDFEVSLTEGGAKINLAGGDGTCTYVKLSALTEDILLDSMQGAFENGGLQLGATRTILTGARQRRKITSVFAEAHAKATPIVGDVGGVSVQKIDTDFGMLNIMVDRFVENDTILVLSMEQLMPVYLEHPDKGHFFVEPLAKTGAQEKVQLYGEIGLKYGNEAAHAKIVGLA